MRHSLEKKDRTDEKKNNNKKQTNKKQQQKKKTQPTSGHSFWKKSCFNGGQTNPYNRLKTTLPCWLQGSENRLGCPRCLTVAQHRACVLFLSRSPKNIAAMKNIIHVGAKSAAQTNQPPHLTRPLTHYAFFTFDDRKGVGVGVGWRANGYC